MLLVIFGAGASYDSVPHLPPYKTPTIATQNNWSPTPQIPPPRTHEGDRPPLANQLFDDRPTFLSVMQNFRECMEIVPWLRKPGVSVEGELARLQSQAHSFPRVHEELAAIRYYLHVALWNCQDNWRGYHRGITSYAVLLREIERWRYASSESVCFVTFNYDTMLEEAMSQVLGFQITDLQGYLQEQYTLVKPHGSVNWGREVDNEQVLSAPHTYNAQRLIAEAAILKVSDRFRLVSERPMNRVVDGRVVFPAISIPVESKDEFNCPSGHMQRLEEMLPKTTRILTVGWRATEGDFIALLHKHLREKPSLMVVSGDARGANETIENLGVALPGVHPTVSNAQPMTAMVQVESGFTGLVLNEIDSLGEFLRSGLPLPGRRRV